MWSEAETRKQQQQKVHTISCLPWKNVHKISVTNKRQFSVQSIEKLSTLKVHKIANQKWFHVDSNTPYWY